MKQNFNDCLTRLLKDEGGYTNDPNDSGGPTNFGITLGDFRRYVKADGTAQDVKNMGIDDAKSIYKSKYWDACSCDTLPSGVDYSVFDYAVNSGTSRARRSLAKFPKLSGVALIDAINDERVSFLNGLTVAQPKDQKFLKGWLARVSRVRTYSKQLASTKNNVTGPTVATGTVAAGFGLSQYLHSHEVLIVVLASALAIAAGFFVHHLINKGK